MSYKTNKRKEVVAERLIPLVQCTASFHQEHEILKPNHESLTNMSNKVEHSDNIIYIMMGINILVVEK